MTYEVGDFVLVRGQVLKVYGPSVGYSIEFFSKTDQYDCAIRPDLVVQKVETPIPHEPIDSAIVRDVDGDLWEFDDRLARWRWKGEERTWEELFRKGGPLTIYQLSEVTDEPRTA